jgi:hypothetical protein
VASKVITTIEDDLDGGKADETLRFAFEGKSFMIDLSSKNAEKFRKAVAPYVAAARREGSIARQNGRPAGTGRSDIALIRAWARENGYTISERGRVAKEIQDAYDAS